jgi:uncharacterized membrane protein
MYGSLVFSDTAIASTDGVISFSHHTSAVHVLNTNSSTSATIRLNGLHQIVIPHTPTQATGVYVCIPGDYTNIEVLTAGVSLSVFAVG